jgi:DNA-directed RNA polymerase specialized sigma24 family protein
MDRYIGLDAHTSSCTVAAWAREGDEDAYRAMLRRYCPPVFDLIYRMVGQRQLAEDLTQETFVKAFRAGCDRSTGGVSPCGTWSADRAAK